MNKHEECFLLTELTTEIQLVGDDDEMKLVWAKGMVGVMPVFDTKEHALDYNKDESLIKHMITVLPDSGE